ncbi:TetR/AcrR family transcriptional regulator [Hamadaea tsunoensis]|uniref:TetR/AcrR family transcriptional regulator n=1 Tax=Hamadaea tsunoensis TaxID=53368 RepID=UPI00047F121B|nr:TetR/AcrR family transcriptional regulator [Hamadaea tsunoensis]
MPTGVAIRDPREQLFDAAERILLRAGPNALTSRAVTAEAGVAKGVLHKHFADFDAFLADLVHSRMARLEIQDALLRGSAGTATVVGNVADALAVYFEPVAVAIVGLVIARDELRSRLRETTPVGVPLMTEAAQSIAGYLSDEQRLGRLDRKVDADAVARMIIGSAHLMYADRHAPPPTPADLRHVVALALP